MYPVRIRTWLRALTALPVVLILACGSAVTPAPHATLVVGEADAGKTFQATIGETVRVKLRESFPVPGSSLVWDVTSNAPSVLAASKVTRDPVQRPLTGQVSYTADFAAAAGGTAQLIARGSTTCEAMPKQGCPDRDFTITVIVS